MFERFTERARQVVVLAQDEARALRHNYIGTEHLLLGLLREQEGIAARVLDSLGITIGEVRVQVGRIVGEGDEATAAQIPFTPRAKKVLELALREAQALGHHYIGTEHLLLGLVRENEGVAARILLELDADAETICGEIIGMLSGGRAQSPGGETVVAMPSGAPGGRVRSFASVPRRTASYVPPRRRSLPPVALLVSGWLLFAAALGVGVLVGWAIWG
jgi:ATP-dependent Clp protease ATP-binding subunit ClpC